MGKKRKNKEDNEFDPAPKHLSIAHIKQQEKRLIIILEYAQLESVKVGNSFELMNCDDHVSILKKNDRQPGSCRPDIVHQCLLMLLDSPLNRGGLLQVYVHTEKNVLIEVNPQTRIPRTFKRFAGLMVQLLHKFNVRASEGSMKLLKVIKNPVTEHLPVGCKKISTSFSSSKLVNPKDIVPKDEPIAIVVGAMAHGQFFNEILNIICMDINTQTHPDQIKTVSLLGYNVLTPQLISSLQINQHYVKTDYTEETISISNYPLSAALTCTKLCSAFEEVWGVV